MTDPPTTFSEHYDDLVYRGLETWPGALIGGALLVVVVGVFFICSFPLALLGALRGKPGGVSGASTG